MSISPKRVVALTAVFGFGLGLLGTLTVEPQTSHCLTNICGTLAGAVGAMGVILVSWWRNRSNDASLHGEWFGVFFVFATVAALLGLSVEAAYSLGAYGVTLLLSAQIREWCCRKPILWQDLKPPRKGREN